MKTPNLLSAFKAAAWTSFDEVDTFVREAGTLPLADVEKLLELLATPEVQTDDRAAEMRQSAFERLATAALHKDLFKPMLRLAPRCDEGTLKVLSRLLPKVYEPQRLPELVATLRIPRREVRRMASGALVVVGGMPVVQALTELIKEPAFPGCREVMDALVMLGGARAVSVVLSCLRVGTAADKVHALTLLGDPTLVGAKLTDVLTAVRELFADPSDEVVAAAIRAFSTNCSEEEFFSTVVRGLASPRLRVVKAVIEAMRRFPIPRALDPLETAFVAGPVAVRLAVLETLQSIPHERVLSLLTIALANPHLVVRTKAAATLLRLTRSGKLSFASTVQWLMRSPEPNVRRTSLEMCLQSQDPDAQVWPELIKHLGDADWWVRTRTVDALVHLAGKKVLARLQPLLTGTQVLMRLYAIEVIERLADPDGLPILLDVIEKDPDPLVQERAVEALGRIEHPQTTALLTQLLGAQPGLRLACLETLATLRARSAAGDVARLLTSSNADVRFAALGCLQRLDDHAQLPAVEACSADPDGDVKRLARSLVARWRAYVPATAAAASDGMLEALVHQAIAADADALVVAANARPLLTRAGVCQPLSDAAISAERLHAAVFPLLDPPMQQRLNNMEEADCSIELKGISSRVRLHVFSRHGGLTAVAHVGRNRLCPLPELDLPEVVNTFRDFRSGLLIIGGGPGSGKSTTLHAIIDHINQHHTRHIITLENSLEVVHMPMRSVLTQREIGRHARSLVGAFKASLREDPDVIAIDELRDLDTINFALAASETGHLVIGVLRAGSTQAAVERIIKAFPPQQADHVQSMLAGSLRAVICQRLMTRAEGGRCAVTEVMLNSSAVANLIRKGKMLQIPSVVATSGHVGMQSMEQDIARRTKAGVIAPDSSRAGM